MKDFILDRARSFGLVVATGFLLMVSLAASAALAAVSGWLASWTPVVPVVLHAVDFLVSFGGTASAYGAVGSVLVLLLWVYYASQILLIGAEFTRLYADRTRGTVPASSFARPPRAS